MRFFRYSAYDSIRKPPPKRASTPLSASNTPCRADGRRGKDGNNNGRGSDDHTSNSCNRTDGEGGGGGIRTTRTSSERRREAKQIFPETLKSGRYKQHETKAQRSYTGPNFSGAAAPDRRFFRRLTDYREVQDDDPYVKVFGERASMEKRRVKEWQRQFEEENEHVELPYERTNILAKLAPNWFVRFFVDMRDRGGIDHLGYLWVCLLVTASLMWCVGSFFYTPPSKSRSIAEVR